MPKRGLIICITILVCLLAGMFYYFNQIQKTNVAHVPLRLPEKKNKPEKGLRLVSDDYGPYVIARYVDNVKQSQNPVGFCSEVTVAVLKRMNIKIQSNTLYPWMRVLRVMKSGQADVVYGLLKNEKRQHDLHFASETLCDYEVKLITCTKKARQFTFDKIENLKGMRIALMKEAHYPGEFIKYCNANCKVTKVISIDQIYRLLRSRRIDVAVMTEEEFKMYESQYRDQGKFVSLGKSLFSAPLYVAFSKKTIKPEFVARFSRALKSFKQTAEFRQICEKYKLTLPAESNRRTTRFSPGHDCDNSTFYNVLIIE